MYFFTINSLTLFRKKTEKVAYVAKFLCERKCIKASDYTNLIRNWGLET